MSFANTADIEDVGDNREQYTDYPEFASLSKTIENELAEINTKELTILRQAIKSPETSAKGVEAVQRVTEKYRHINELVKNLNEQISVAQDRHEDVTTIKYLKQKEAIVIKLVKNSISRFRDLKDRIESTSNAALEQEASSAGFVSGSAGGSPVQQHGSESVQINYEPINSEELEQQTLEIQQREQEIHRIQQDTSTINEIFQNLQSIVDEQQVSVDSIEANLYNYSEDARGASHELRRAERYQRRTGGRMMCCLIILLVVAAVIMLAILL